MDRIGQLYHLNAVRLSAQINSPERLSANLDLEQAVQQMASDCAAGVVNHETFPGGQSVGEHDGALGWLDSLCRLSMGRYGQ